MDFVVCEKQAADQFFGIEPQTVHLESAQRIGAAFSILLQRRNGNQNAATEVLFEFDGILSVLS
jgi:hypothetical protein